MQHRKEPGEAHDQLRVAGDGWTWQEAEREFLQRFAELTTR